MSDNNPVNNTTLPVHIAFIMDGNGRWAKNKHLPRSFGHDAGTKALERIIEHCYKKRIKYITFYAFSTENWSRPKNEVDHLMNLFSNYIDTLTERIEQKTPGIYQDTVLRFLGDMSVLPEKIRNGAEYIERLSADPHKSMTLNIALNYGGRDEILNAVNNFILKHPGEKITQKSLEANLYTHDMPDPDLIIRTAGEMRLSNFLLWQSAYSEFYFAKTLWPDFTPDELDVALEAFSHRERKYGNVK